VLLTRLYGYLLEQYSKRERVVLIIDEAQNLSEKTLEEIRMLSNLESEKHHLLQMILVGQPQLKEKLQRKSLEQFVQRVTVYCHLDALDKVEVENYIHHRLTVAGAQNPDLFDPEAIKAICKHSLGIPRLINTLCDAAFVYGYADDVKVIGRDLIEAVAKARTLGVKGDGRDSALPEDQEKGGGVIPESQAWLLKELEGRIRALELQLASHGESFLNIRKELEARNGRPDERDKIIIMLFRMLKKSMDRRANLAMKVVQIKDIDASKKRRASTGLKQPSLPPDSNE
jgi:general secretion pathway protein A